MASIVVFENMGEASIEGGVWTSDNKKLAELLNFTFAKLDPYGPAEGNADITWADRAAAMYAGKVTKYDTKKVVYKEGVIY